MAWAREVVELLTCPPGTGPGYKLESGPSDLSPSLAHMACEFSDVMGREQA